jgi:outer membrane protein OmpA-like peptidoglycan-associated protein
MTTPSSLLKYASLIVILFTLTACQTMHGLNKKQIKVLQHQGFVLTNEGWTLGLPERLLFASDEATLNDDKKNDLIKLGQQLTQVSILNLKVNGHTDSTGAESYNLELSKKRAESVAAPLIQGGIPTANIQTYGLADRQPLASNETVEGRASNRRVTIIVIP